MPEQLPDNSEDVAAAFDQAFERQGAYLKDKFQQVIDQNTHWRKFKHVYMFFVGAFTSALLGWLPAVF